uniref:Ovule protein n=1 Tax=Parascaris univalens TaxID=6257 RepID=A0A914ZM77_PARUN
GENAEKICTYLTPTSCKWSSNCRWNEVGASSLHSTTPSSTYFLSTAFIFDFSTAFPFFENENVKSITSRNLVPSSIVFQLFLRHPSFFSRSLASSLQHSPSTRKNFKLILVTSAAAEKF